MKRLLVPLALAVAATLIVLPRQDGSARTGVAAGIAALTGAALALAVQEGVTELAAREPSDALRRRPSWQARLVRPLARRLPRRARAAPTDELATLEHAVAASLRDGPAAHLFLLPQLRTLAADRLRVERGVELWRAPDDARAVLGEGAWALLSPRRQSLGDVPRQGLDAGQLASTLDALEGLEGAGVEAGS